MSDEPAPALPKHLAREKSSSFAAIMNTPRPAPTDYAQSETRSHLKAIEEELSRTALEEIAARLSKLTYGEMKELCLGIKAEPDAVWDWSTGYNGR